MPSKIAKTTLQVTTSCHFQETHVPLKAFSTNGDKALFTSKSHESNMENMIGAEPEYSEEILL